MTVGTSFPVPDPERRAGGDPRRGLSPAPTSGPPGYLGEGDVLRAPAGGARARASSAASCRSRFSEQARWDEGLAGPAPHARPVRRRRRAGARPVLCDAGGPERVANPGRGGEDAVAAPRRPPLGHARRRRGARRRRRPRARLRAGLPPPHVHLRRGRSPEIERFLEDTDVALLLDSGHLAVAGGDPIAALRDWGERIGAVHVKDVRLGVLARREGRARRHAHGVAARPVLRAGRRRRRPRRLLRRRSTRRGYDGWVVIEQDRVLEDAAAFDGAAAEQRATARGCASTRDGEPMDRFDVITMGRIGVDVYPLQTGVSLREVESFGKFLGGSADQRRRRRRALRAAQRGRSRARATTRSAPFLHDALRGFGVDDRWVTAVAGPPHAGHVLRDLPARRLPALLLPRAQGARPRDPHRRSSTSTRSAPARVFWVTVTGLSQEPSRSATLAALEARAKAGITVLDLDYRPMFWRTRARRRARWIAAGPRARRRSRSATSTSARPPSASASRARRRGRCTPGRRPGGRQAGPEGRAGRRRRATAVEVPPVPVEVVNGLGAGDAFGGALCHGLLAGWDLERTDALLQRRRRARRLAPGLRRRDAAEAEVEAMLRRRRA